MTRELFDDEGVVQHVLRGIVEAGALLVAALKGAHNPRALKIFVGDLREAVELFLIARIVRHALFHDDPQHDADEDRRRRDNQPDLPI